MDYVSLLNFFITIGMSFLSLDRLRKTQSNAEFLLAITKSIPA